MDTVRAKCDPLANVQIETMENRSFAFASALFACGLTACISDDPSVAPIPFTDAGTTPGVDASDSSVKLDAAPEAAPTCGVIGATCCAGNQCGGDATCTGGSCACAQPKVACGSSCIDFQTNPDHCGACNHGCVGGACTGGICQPSTLVTGQLIVTSIVPQGSKLYWTRSHTNTQKSGVFASDLNGQNMAPIYDAGTTAYCNGLALSTTSAFFACAGQILRCTLPACAPNPTALGAASVSALAFDSVNDRLYFTNYTQYNQFGGGFVASIPSAGGAISRLAQNDQPNPSSIVIENGMGYWLNAGTYQSDNPQYNGGVNRAPLGTNQPVNVVTADTSGTDYSSLAIQGGVAYWTSGMQIRTSSAVAGPSSTYASSVSKSYIRVVIADASYVYWSEDNGGVYRCEKNCTKPTLIAATTNTFALAQDSVSIYWSTGVGDIRRLAK
ncbi:hypothetical protein BH09MYX1_BH09MYX1_03800 [soil metagenome]